MKLRNKKTGEICDFKIIADYDDCTSGWRLEKHNGTVLFYDHIDEIHEEWEDYEEPKWDWYIDWDGEIKQCDNRVDALLKFETKEEAEKAVEKLKAWKRLEDGGITFKNWSINQTGTIDCFATWGDNIPPSRKNPTLLDELDLLFGGEE